MKYFLANLGVHLFVTLICVVLVVITANRNKRGKTAHRISYFLPVIFSIITVVYLVVYTAPRMLDIVDVISQNYYSYTGYVDEIAPANNYIVIDGTSYYINPLRDLPQEGAYVRVRYTTYSKYAIEVSPAEEMNAEDAAADEAATT